MAKSWAMMCVLALGTLSTARAACDDLDNYLNVPSPLNGDTTITLSVGAINCPRLDPRTNPIEVEQVIIEGGTLTIASDSTVQFINVAILIMPGAGLVFDMPETLVGPNTPSGEDFPSGTIFEVSEGASLTFNGDVTMEDVDNVRNLLENFGSTEFKKTALFENNVNGIAENTGTLKFRGDTTFKDNRGVGVSNSDGGTVRFSTTATFDDNGNVLESGGCDVDNNDSTSKMSFRGFTIFKNSSCDGSPLTNKGIINFYRKVRFNDNVGQTDGGAIRNFLGSMTFRRAVQFNNNRSHGDGGAIAVDGGDVTFRKAVKFNGNIAHESGGAFAVLVGDIFDNGFVVDTDPGSLTFGKPSAVRFVDNGVDLERGDGRISADCTIGEVEEGTTLIGFTGDDVCVAAT